MAAAVLRQRLPLSSQVQVNSAGFLPQGAPAAGRAVIAMQRYGIDLGSHRSRQVSAADVSSNDLVLAMTRAHMRRLIEMQPSAWTRIFTLKDFLTRIETSYLGWDEDNPASTLAELGVGRSRMSMLGDSPVDDIKDPMGKSPAVWTAVTREIVDQADRLALALTPRSTLGAEPPTTLARRVES